MMAILWRSESICPVEEWDRLSFTDCEGLLRGLYRSAGVSPSAAVSGDAAGSAPQAGDGATARSGRAREDRQTRRTS